ncbi:flagellar motor protein [Polynucleobacter sp. MWH-Mekk-B1]|uniref:Flagellar motor protein n=1 Tax=Polynucleobacter aenigmaticus TaxID=1743164 RepID=A0A254PZ94_9BURK|nr:MULTISPECIES: flagellar motor protein [Polynucleobacter]MBU3545125.1 flagellar motor protein [Polynucleobacter finlandensis]OWS71880.1 flagellar motor protein [Polynucleobacter aenigmaticus]
MDWASIGGLTLALLGIFIGQSIDGGKLSSLLQPSAFVIVVFGTFGAVLLQSKSANFLSALNQIRWIFINPVDNRLEIAHRISMWSSVARKEGTLHLERFLDDEPDPLTQKCLRLVIDGIAPQTIRDICENELHQYEVNQRSAIKVWDSAGSYAPTIGILAAVIGLIHVMENLADPAMLGSGIAVAFVATIYGVGLANLVFIPIANKLKGITQTEVSRYEMIIDSLSSIANGEHTIIIDERLSGYLI